MNNPNWMPEAFSGDATEISVSPKIKHYLAMNMPPNWHSYTPSIVFDRDLPESVRKQIAILDGFGHDQEGSPEIK